MSQKNILPNMKKVLMKDKIINNYKHAVLENKI